MTNLHGMLFFHDLPCLDAISVFAIGTRFCVGKNEPTNLIYGAKIINVMYIYVWGDTVIPIALEEKGPSIKSGEEKPFIHFIIDTSYISSNIFS